MEPAARRLMEVMRARRALLRTYNAVQTTRIRALEVLTPDSQMCIDWLEMEYHLRRDVADYTDVLSKFVYSGMRADALIGVKTYAHLQPSILELGIETCPKASVVPASQELVPSQENQDLERDVTNEWLVLSPQSVSDQA